MKRFIISIATILVSACIVLCGCGKRSGDSEKVQREVAETVRRPFTTTADIHYGELTAKAKMLNEPSGFELEFTEPEALEGMGFCLSDDVITIQYKDVETQMSVDEFYSSSVVKMIVSSINKATSESGIMIEMDDNTITINGTGDSGNFYLLLDRENGNMLNLSIPESEFSVDFYGFGFKDK